MSDFFTSVDMLRGQVSEMLCDNEEQAMWVLGDISARIDPSDLAENIDTMDQDPEEVVKFFRELADLIEKSNQ